MGEVKGYRLYVNLPASQVRRRLKGYGFGVRKVESAGKGQALVIHTATGRHYRDLQSLFGDVKTAENAEQLGSPIAGMRNLGSASAAWLREIDVHSETDLRQLSPAVAYLLVKQQHPEASLNLLWALAASLQDKDWRELTDAEKDVLLRQIGKN